MAQLADKYGGTAYAPRGALIVAALLFDNGDKAGAKAQLASVIDRDTEDELKEIARLRLAAILFDDKQYDDALRTLDAKHDDAVRRHLRRPPRRHPRRAGRTERGARRVPDGAGAPRPEEPVPQLRAGEARRAAAGAASPPGCSGARRASRSRPPHPPQLHLPHPPPLPLPRSPPRPNDRRHRPPHPSRRLRGSSSRSPRHSPLAGCSTLSSWMPSIPAAVVRLVLAQQEARAAARIQGPRHAAARVAGRRRQGGARARARRHAATRSTPPPRTARSCASIPASGQIDVAHRRGKAPVGAASARTRRSSPSAPTRARCSRSRRTASRCGRRR